MVEGMGGANSPYYQNFRSYCFVAFSILRRSSNLILNLFSLMVNANIPDIAIEPDKAVLKVSVKEVKAYCVCCVLEGGRDLYIPPHPFLPSRPGPRQVPLGSLRGRGYTILSNPYQ